MVIHTLIIEQNNTKTYINDSELSPFSTTISTLCTAKKIHCIYYVSSFIVDIRFNISL